MSNKSLPRKRRALVAFASLLTFVYGGYSLSPAPASSAPLQRDVAVEWAKAQIGKPYAYGGVGPAAFDCSGLVMQAWAAAGVPLPRIANQQSVLATRVPLDQVQTGDIVFWGSHTNDPNSVYHEAIYANDGIVVVAPNNGGAVQLSLLTNTAYGLMPYAVRPVQ